MKVLLEFTLPRDNDELKMAQNGSSYLYALQDLDNWLRNKIKYTDETQLDLQTVRAKLYEILDSRNIGLQE